MGLESYPDGKVESEKLKVERGKEIERGNILNPPSADKTITSEFLGIWRLEASAPLGIEELEALGKGWEMLVDVERCEKV